MDQQNRQQWTIVIKATDQTFQLRLKELFQNTELIWVFCKRYFSSMYRQTILGPAWLILNPLLTSVVFTVIFGNLAQLSTDGLPQILFYLSGTTIWTLTAGTLTACAQTYEANGYIYAKVYFPRMVIPASSLICGIINFFIQMLMVMIFWIYYYITGASIQPNLYLFYLPVLILQAAMLGTGVGLIATALTTKYKDLNVLISFGVQLWMYATPIVYPLSETSIYLRRLIVFNPMTPVVEAFRYALLGAGEFSWPYLMLSLGVTVGILLMGIGLFNQAGKKFVDTI